MSPLFLQFLFHRIEQLGVFFFYLVLDCVTSDASTGDMVFLDSIMFCFVFSCFELGYGK